MLDFSTDLWTFCSCYFILSGEVKSFEPLSHSPALIITSQVLSFWQTIKRSIWQKEMYLQINVENNPWKKFNPRFYLLTPVDFSFSWKRVEYMLGKSQNSSSGTMLSAFNPPLQVSQGKRAKGNMMLLLLRVITLLLADPCLDEKGIQKKDHSPGLTHRSGSAVCSGNEEICWKKACSLNLSPTLSSFHCP